MRNIFLSLAILLSSYICAQNIAFEIDNFPAQEAKFKVIEKKRKEANTLFVNGTSLCKFDLSEMFCVKAAPYFQEALELYLEVQEFNPDNALLNFRIGICYFTSNNKHKALPYFHSVEKLDPDTDPYFPFYYALSLQNNNEWEKAIRYFKKVKESLNNEKSEIKRINKTKKEIGKYISDCEFGLSLKTPEKEYPIVLNMGNTINSPYPDFGPVLLANNKIMLYTSKRIDTSAIQQFTNPFEYETPNYELMLISSKKDSMWSTAKNLTIPDYTVNASYAVLAVDTKGTTALIYKNGDIFKSTYFDGNWSDLSLIEGELNTVDIESSACFTEDRSKLFFTSNRKGGRGGMDIYVAKMDSTGSCTSVKNLGAVVNTAFDEDGIFFHDKTNTLFFSSKGHKGLGGFDIFTTTFTEDSTWTTPQNIGLPYNSALDDIFFSISNDLKSGFFTSYRKDTYGEEDIYCFTQPYPLINIQKNDTTNIEFAISQPDTIAKTIPLVSSKAQIIIKTRDAITNQPVEAFISIMNKQKEVIYNNKPTDRNGELRSELGTNNYYQISAIANGYNADELIFYVPQNAPEITYEKYLSPKADMNVLSDTISDIEVQTYGATSIIEGRVFDYLEDDNIEAYIEIVEIETDSVYAKTKTNAKSGKFTITVPSDKNYKINAIANGYMFNSGKISTNSYNDLVEVNNALIKKGNEFIAESIDENLIQKTMRASTILQGNVIDDITHTIVPSKIIITDTLHDYKKEITVPPNGQFIVKVPLGGTYNVSIITPPDYYPIETNIVANNKDIRYTINPDFIKRTKPKVNIPLATILFETNKFDCADDYIEEKLGQINRNDLRNYNISITGHTDNAGSAGFNEVLSEKRTEFIATYLKQNFAIEKEQLYLYWEGENSPVSSNFDEIGRTLNRRVEITLKNK